MSQQNRSGNSSSSRGGARPTAGRPSSASASSASLSSRDARPSPGAAGAAGRGGTGSSRGGSSRGGGASGRGASGSGGGRKGGRTTPPSLWARRIITGLGLLLIVSCVVWGAWKGVSALMGLKNRGNVASATPAVSATPSASASSAAAPTPDSSSTASSAVQAPRPGETLSGDGFVAENGNVRIPECLMSDLVVTPAVTMTQVGAGEKVAVTVENRSPVACRFEAGRLDVKILSGEQTMYDSSRCDRDRESTVLLLAAGKSWKGSLDWDGRVYSGCTAVDGNDDGAHDIADAGTYRAQVVVGSLPVGSEKVFVIQ